MSRSHSDMLIDIQHLRSCLDCIERPVFFTEQDYQQHSLKHHHSHVHISESQTTEPMIEEIDFHRRSNTLSERYAEERNYFRRQTEEDSNHHNQSSFLTREKDMNAFQWGESKLSQFVDDITSIKEELRRNGSKLKEVFNEVSNISTCVLPKTSVRNRTRYDDAVKGDRKNFVESMHRDELFNGRTNENSVYQNFHGMEKVFEEFQHLLKPINSEAQNPADKIDHDNSSLNPLDTKQIENNSHKIESLSKSIENQTKMDEQEKEQGSIKRDCAQIELLNKSLIEEHRYLMEKIDVLEVMTSEKEFQLQSLKEGNEMLMQHLNSEKEKCHYIHVQFHGLREEYDSLKKSCTNTVGKEDFDSLQRRSNTLQEELINLTASYDLKVTELSQKQLDLDHTRHVLEMFKRDMEKIELNHSQQSQILEEQYNENMRQLQSTVDQNVIEMKNMKDQLSHRTNECDSLNQKVVLLTQEIDELMSNYEALKASSEIGAYELNKKPLSYEENIHEMKLQLENLLSTKIATDDECEKLKSQLKEQQRFASKLEASRIDMQEKNVLLQTEYSELEENYHEQENKMKEHEERNVRLQQEINGHNDLLQKKNGEIEANVKCLKGNENDAQAYKAKIKELESELHTAKEKELVVFNQKDVLSAEIDELKSEFLCLKNEKDKEIRLLKENLEIEQKSSRDSNKEVKTHLKNKSKELKQVEKSLSMSKIKIDTLKKELANVDKSFEEAKQNISSLESNIKQKTKDCCVQAKKCELLKVENADLGKKVEELKIEVDNLKKGSISTGLSEVIDKELFPVLPTSTTDKEVDTENNDAVVIPKRNWGEEFMLKRLSKNSVSDEPANTEEYTEVSNSDLVQKERTIKEWLSPPHNRLQPLELSSKEKRISPSTLQKCVKPDGGEFKGKLDCHENESNSPFDSVKREGVKDSIFMKSKPSKDLKDLSTLDVSSSSLVDLSPQVEISNLSLKSLPPLVKGSSFSVIDSNHLLGNESWGTLGSNDSSRNGSENTEKSQDKILERAVDHEEYSDDFENEDEGNPSSEHFSDFGHEDIATLLDGL